jgi:serine/threonine-protein kinase HipA
MNERILIPTIFGQEIGVLMEGKNGISFQYHPHFDAQRYPISPLRLPYDPTRVFNYYDSMPFDGLPGIFADSLPDSFGNIALREYFKRKYRTSHLKLSPLEKLAYVGNHGIGAITYRPAIGKEDEYDLSMELQQYAQEMRGMMQGDVSTILDEILAHPSPGGARPKAALQWNEQENIISLRQTPIEGFEPWIIKFDEAGREETKLEYLYMEIARKSGITVPEYKQIIVGDEVHFASKRFDRMYGKKYHQATLAALIHGDFMRQNACTYEAYFRLSEALTHSPAQTKEAFRRMVFNVIGKNCDDHIKNFSFLMNEEGTWKLSPAYDLIYSYGPIHYGEHKMSINGKNYHITLEDMAQCGYSVGLEKRFMKETIEQISDQFSKLPILLKETDISEDLQKELLNNITPINVSTFPESKRKHR